MSRFWKHEYLSYLTVFTLALLLVVGCGGGDEPAETPMEVSGWIPDFDTTHYEFVNSFLADTTRPNPDDTVAFILIDVRTNLPKFWKTPSGKQCLLLFTNVQRAIRLVRRVGFDSVAAAAITEKNWEVNYPDLKQLGMEMVTFNLCLDCPFTPTVNEQLMAGNIAKLARAAIAEEHYIRDWFFAVAGRTAAAGELDSLHWAGQEVSKIAPFGLEGPLILLAEHSLTGRAELAAAMSDSLVASPAAQILVDMIESLDQKPKVWNALVDKARQQL